MLSWGLGCRSIDVLPHHCIAMEMVTNVFLGSLIYPYFEAYRPAERHAASPLILKYKKRNQAPHPTRP